MNPNTALVITSIFQPNDIMVEFAAKSKIHGIQFIVAGDTKSPDNFQLDGCDYYSVAMQENLPFAYARLCPKAHYARKNMGYLVAASNGAQIIIESDDDNMPKETFWLPKNIQYLKCK